MDYDKPTATGAIDLSGGSNDAWVTVPFEFLIEADDSPPGVRSIRIGRVDESTHFWKRRPVGDFSPEVKVYSEDADSTGGRREITARPFPLRRDSAGKNLLHLKFRVDQDQLTKWLEPNHRGLLLFDVGFTFDSGNPEVVFRQSVRRKGERQLEVQEVRRIRVPKLVVLNLVLFLAPVGILLWWNHYFNQRVHRAPFYASTEFISLAAGFLLGYFGLQLAKVIGWLSEFRRIKEFVSLPELFLPRSTFRAFRSPTIVVIAVILSSLVGWGVIRFRSASIVETVGDLPRAHILVVKDADDHTVESPRVYLSNLVRPLQVMCLDEGTRRADYPVARIYPDMPDGDSAPSDLLSVLEQFANPPMGLYSAQVGITYDRNSDAVRILDALDLLRSGALDSDSAQRSAENEAVVRFLCGSTIGGAPRQFFVTPVRVPGVARNEVPTYLFHIDYGMTMPKGEAFKRWRGFVQRMRARYSQDAHVERDMKQLTDELLAQEFTEQAGNLSPETIVALLKGHMEGVEGERAGARRRLLESRLLLGVAAARSPAELLSSAQYQEIVPVLQGLKEVKNLPDIDKRTFRAIVSFAVALERRCAEGLDEDREVVIPGLLTGDDGKPLDEPILHLIALRAAFEGGLLNSHMEDRASRVKGFFAERRELMKKSSAFEARVLEMRAVATDSEAREFLDKLIAGPAIQAVTTPN